MNNPENLTNKKLIELLKGLTEPVPAPNPERMEQGRQRLLEEAKTLKKAGLPSTGEEKPSQ